MGRLAVGWSDHHKAFRRKLTVEVEVDCRTTRKKEVSSSSRLRCPAEHGVPIDRYVHWAETYWIEPHESGKRWKEGEKVKVELDISSIGSTGD